VARKAAATGRSVVRRLAVVPGDGYLQRDDELILLVGNDGSPTAVAELFDHWAKLSATGAGRKAFARRLAGWLATTELDPLPSFVAARASDDGLAVLLRGSSQVVVVDDTGSQSLGAHESAAWIDRVFTDPCHRLELSCGDVRTEVIDPYSDLRSGTVSAGAAVAMFADDVDSGILAPQPVDGERIDAAPATGGSDQVARPTEHVPVDAPEPIEELSMSARLIDAQPDPDRKPLPIVGEQVQRAVLRGVMCKNQHFNDPRAAFCGLCGISMNQVTHHLVEGVRPPLGVLVLDDGTTIRMDDDYLIGREPDIDPLVSSGEARPLELNDAEGTVSRSHALLRLVDWDVQLIDRHSANGTYLAAPKDTAWTRLTADQPETLSPGTRIQIGQRTLVFDGHFRI
jgi:hypothetical protein